MIAMPPHTPRPAVGRIVILSVFHVHSSVSFFTSRSSPIFQHRHNAKIRKQQKNATTFVATSRQKSSLSQNNMTIVNMSSSDTAILFTFLISLLLNKKNL